jgi:D-beta-D-heptose 7-phosphate kinase / D-beta-D-heptose 1-phosphate adenosyltransferase
MKKMLPSIFYEKQVDDRTQLMEWVKRCRSQGKRVVFTNGCFDLLHPGHVTYLQQAKELGEVLIVAVNSDESVARLKGPERPINTLHDRMMVLKGLESVDMVVSFEEDTPVELVKVVRPDVYVKGGDYAITDLPEALWVEIFGGVVEILPFVGEQSTTGIISKITRQKRAPGGGYGPKRMA